MLFNAVRSRDEVTVGSKATARRFIHVDDIAAGILASRGRYDEVDLFGKPGGYTRLPELACGGQRFRPTTRWALRVNREYEHVVGWNSLSADA